MFGGFEEIPNSYERRRQGELERNHCGWFPEQRVDRLSYKWQHGKNFGFLLDEAQSKILLGSGLAGTASFWNKQGG